MPKTRLVSFLPKGFYYDFDKELRNVNVTISWKKYLKLFDFLFIAFACYEGFFSLDLQEFLSDFALKKKKKKICLDSMCLMKIVVNKFDSCCL